MRCLYAITRDRLESLREADAILREEFARAGLDRKVWQHFTVVSEFRSVGILDGKRSYEFPAILRAVNTVDAMTAEIELVDGGFCSGLHAGFCVRSMGSTGF